MRIIPPQKPIPICSKTSDGLVANDAIYFTVKTPTAVKN
jgi:hypothetical protein